MSSTMCASQDENASNHLQANGLSKIESTGNNDNDQQTTSGDIVESTTKINCQSSSTGFDVQRVYQAFVSALREPENPNSSIGTQEYIDGYRELVK
jgi:hypothetical protein